MTPPSTYKVSQSLVVRGQKSNDAFIIPCHEWDFLKAQLKSIKLEAVMFQTVGALLLGAAISTLTPILFGAIDTTKYPSAVIVAWAVVAVTAICGAVCLYFGNKQQDLQQTHAGTVLKQMELIEARFD